MRAFASRRWLNILFLLLFSAFSLFVYKIYDLSLRHSGFVTGWSLFFLIVLLALYNARKKIPFLPLLTSAAWLQIHIYAGLLTAVIFFLHVDFRIPNGITEWFLTLLFLLVWGSGIIGIFLSRVIPRRLTTRGEEIIYERIPVFQRQIRKELEKLIQNYVSETNSVTLVDFYAERLVPFFDKPRHFGWHLVQSNRPRYALLNELEALQRYLSEKERDKAGEISELIILKDDLDYQYAHQAVLKYWLFLHIPLTYSLLLVSLLHAALVYAFIGGI